MVFTNKRLPPAKKDWGLIAVGNRSRIYRKILIALLAVSLASCGGMSVKPGGKSKKASGKPAAEKTVSGSKKKDVIVPVELIPNPYLKSRGSVPARAKKEFAAAQGAMQAKKYKKAYGLWIMMTEVYPKLSGPYVNLGISAWKLKDLEEAENAFKMAIQVNKNNMDAYSQLGIFYRQQGKFKEAEQVYLQALKVWPHHLDSILNIGVLYDLYMGRFKEALKYYKLSQRVMRKPSKQVKGWIVDLERRIAAGK